MQPSRSAGGPHSTASRRAAASSSAAAAPAAPAAQDRSSLTRDMGCRSALVDGPPTTAPLQDAVLLGIDAIARRRTSIGPPPATQEVVHPDELDDRFADDEDSHLDGSPGRRRVFAEMMKRKAKALHGVRACQKCHRSKTPRWRKGPSGPKTLCNVCGLVYAKRESWRLRDSWLANISRGP